MTITTDFTKYDPRVDSLVVETRTCWDCAVGTLAEADKNWLASVVHRQASQATKIEYDRAHTGFPRTITVTVADIERIYQEKLSG